MPNNTVTFISSNGRGLTKNLHLVRRELFDKQFEFSYYLKNIKKSKSQALIEAQALIEQAKTGYAPSLAESEYNPLSDKEMLSDRNSFAKRAENIICCDDSLPKSREFFKTPGSRTLILEPYNYFFKSVLEYMSSKHGTAEQNLSFVNFNKIISYTPFLNEIAQKVCPMSSGEYICDAAIPFSYSIIRERDKTQARMKAERIFPQITGKKVISILTTGANQKGTDTKFFDLDIKTLCRELPEDWIIVTNNSLIGEKTSVLSADHAGKIVCVEASSFMFADILYFSEILITDAPNYACIFASSKKPFYVINFDDSAFTDLIKRFYSPLFISELNEIPELIKSSSLSAAHLDFAAKFAPSVAVPYSDGRRISDIVCE